LLNIVIFTRVRSVKGSPTIRSDTGYSEIPGSRDSYCYIGLEMTGKYGIELTDARNSSRHLNICQSRFGLMVLSNVGSARLVKSSNCLWW